MDACMHDYAKEYRKHGEIKSNMMESTVTTPFGKDYGFNCVCNKGSIMVPKFSTTFEYLSGDGTTPISIVFVEKSRLGVVSRDN